MNSYMKNVKRKLEEKVFKTMKLQQYTFREGSFARIFTFITNFEFHDIFPCKTLFLIIYLINSSIRNVHDKIMSLVSSINVNLQQVLLPIHFWHLFNSCKSKLILNEKCLIGKKLFSLTRNNSVLYCLDIRTLRRHWILYYVSIILDRFLVRSVTIHHILQSDGNINVVGSIQRVFCFHLEQYGKIIKIVYKV